MVESGSFVDAARYESLKISIFDDNRLDRLILTEYVKATDREVLISENGEAALSMWNSEWPDIVITDIELPEIDGYSIIEHIRANEHDDNIAKEPFKLFDPAIVDAFLQLAPQFRIIASTMEDQELHVYQSANPHH